MTIQAVLLGISVPILLGAVFHLWRGGPGWRLGLYIILSMMGFWLGHWAANSRGWDFLNVGALQMGAGLIGSVIVLGVGFFLSNKQPEPDKKRVSPTGRGVHK